MKNELDPRLAAVLIVAALAIIGFVGARFLLPDRGPQPKPEVRAEMERRFPSPPADFEKRTGSKLREGGTQ